VSFAAALWLALATAVGAHPPPTARPVRIDPIAESKIHKAPGFVREGKPQVYSDDDAARVRVTVVDRADARPTFCRVNVVGSDGHFYEPAANTLANWSFFRQGNRLGMGPFRYYGWFFYSSGEFEVVVPPGPTRIEVWKGFEYRPIAETLTTTAGKISEARIELERVAPMSDEGYYSGDTHIHLPRRDGKDDERALDLMACEDIGVGYLLSANESRSYSGDWKRQPIAPQRVQGAESIVRRGRYEIASGQEYVTGSYGHLAVVMQRRTLLEGLTVDPSRWPMLGVMALEGRKLGGISFNLHGGNGGEVYLDFAQQATDGVELLQFAHYRGIGLDGWYRMLNIGCRFPAVGACDYPFCRVLGDCRTYVQSGQRPDAVAWARGAAQGRSFFTTGPLLLLEVNGHRPGDVIRLSAGDTGPLEARVRVRSEVAAITDVELIVNGKSVAHRAVAAGASGKWFEFSTPLEVKRPLWVAARAWSKAPPEHPDAEAHTNPVYVVVENRLPYDEADLDWLVEQMDDVAESLAQRTFDEKAEALKFCETSKAALLDIRRTRGLSLDEAKP
jgi:hypothetical protein